MQNSQTVGLLGYSLSWLSTFFKLKLNNSSRVLAFKTCFNKELSKCKNPYHAYILCLGTLRDVTPNHPSSGSVQTFPTWLVYKVSSFLPCGHFIWKSKKKKKKIYIIYIKDKNIFTLDSHRKKLLKNASNWNRRLQEQQLSV